MTERAMTTQEAVDVVEKKPGIAAIAPTGYGSFGIWWADFPAMERRGGYSGPYRSREDAERSAREWGDTWSVPVRIEHREETPE